MLVKLDPRIKKPKALADPNAPVTDPNAPVTYPNGTGQTPTGQVGNQPVYYSQPNDPVQPTPTPTLKNPSPGTDPATTPGDRIETPGDPTGNKSRWNPEAKAQMDAVGQQYGYQWSDAEYDQWLGSDGYINKDDVDGAGNRLGAYAGGEILPYWLMRMGYHARGEDYGGGVDQMRARQAAGLQDYGFNGATSTESATATRGLDQWMPPGGGTAPSAPSAAGGTSLTSLYQQRIADLLNTPQTVDQAALEASPEAQAAQLTRQRSEERQRGKLMERAAADGFSGGAVDSEMRSIRQDLAENEIGLMATVAQQKMQENRAALVQGIQFAQAEQNRDQELALRERLASLDAAIQRESMRIGQSEGASERALRRELGLAGIGYNYDALGASLNQRTAELLLNGGY